MKNKFLIYLTGNVLYGFAQWIIILILVKQNLMTELGVYSYAIALIGPIYLFYSFGLSTLIVTSQVGERLDYLSHRIVSSFIMLITFIVIIIAFSNVGEENFILLVGVALINIINGLVEVNFSYYIKNQKQHIVGYIKIFMSLLLISTIVFFTLIIEELYLAFYLYFIVIFILFLVLNRDIYLMKFDYKKYMKICLIGGPISLTLLASSLNTNVPRYLLEHFGTIELVGIFSSLLVVYSAGNTLISSIYNYILPKFVIAKEVKSYNLRLLKNIIIVGIALIIVSQMVYLLISEKMILILYTSEFLRYEKHLNIILISSILIYMSKLLDVFINGYGKYKHNTVIQVINLIIITVVGILLIPKFLLLGAALSFMTFGVMIFLLKFILTLNILRRKFYE